MLKYTSSERMNNIPALRTFVTFLLIVKACFAADAYERPQWHGPNRDAKSTETGLLKSWPPAGPPLLWYLGAPARCSIKTGGSPKVPSSTPTACSIVTRKRKELWPSSRPLLLNPSRSSVPSKSSKAPINTGHIRSFEKAASIFAMEIRCSPTTLRSTNSAIAILSEFENASFTERRSNR